jgi:hypothetical protein
MRNRDANAAPVPATDIEVSMAAGLKGLKDLVGEWRGTLDAMMTVEQIAERSLSIVTAYLAGELPPAIAAEVSDILRTEPLLRAAHARLFAAWQAPNAERVVSDAEVDAAYGRFKALRTAKFGAGGGGTSGA